MPRVRQRHIYTVFYDRSSAKLGLCFTFRTEVGKAKPEPMIQTNKLKKVEILFANMKRVLKMDRPRLRGFTGANDEFLLTAAAQNLRRMAQWLGTGPPELRATAIS